MPGPIGGCTFKCLLKQTQEEDTEEHDRVKRMTTRIISKERKHVDDLSESLRRLLAGSHAHQTNNILGAAMASFLTRNGSRFLFSHDFVWCPLRDLEALLQGKTVQAHTGRSSRGCFFQNTALVHCLCRPKAQLEDCSFKEFLSKWETKNVTKSNEEDLHQFKNTPHFQHPSFRAGKGQQQDRFLQGTQRREKPVLAKVFQHDFPDAAKFNGSILLESTPITEDSETFSKLVLLLFLPLRCHNDMLLNGSCTKRLQKAVGNEKFKKKLRSFSKTCRTLAAIAFGLTPTRMTCSEEQSQ